MAGKYIPERVTCSPVIVSTHISWPVSVKSSIIVSEVDLQQNKKYWININYHAGLHIERLDTCPSYHVHQLPQS